jgi:hypothetical protein
VTHYYLGHKPGSKRGDAVITLGKQALGIARVKAQEYKTIDALKNMKIVWAQKDILLT